MRYLRKTADNTLKYFELINSFFLKFYRSTNLENFNLLKDKEKDNFIICREHSRITFHISLHKFYCTIKIIYDQVLSFKDCYTLIFAIIRITLPSMRCPRSAVASCVLEPLGGTLETFLRINQEYGNNREVAQKNNENEEEMEID